MGYDTLVCAVGRSHHVPEPKDLCAHVASIVRCDTIAEWRKKCRLKQREKELLSEKKTGVVKVKPFKSEPDRTVHNIHTDAAT